MNESTLLPINPKLHIVAGFADSSADDAALGHFQKINQGLYFRGGKGHFREHGFGFFQWPAFAINCLVRPSQLVDLISAKAPSFQAFDIYALHLGLFTGNRYIRRNALIYVTGVGSKAVFADTAKLVNQ